MVSLLPEKKTILIVDDEPDLVEALADFLELEGYRVRRAFNGEEGLASLKQMKPDLIILDVKMPKMSGIEFCRRIYRPGEHKTEFPVLVLTGREYLEPVFKEINVDGFMSKPFSFDDLTRKIKAILSGEPVAPAPKVHPAGKKQKKIMIVEDDKSILDQMIVSFAKAGYAVSATHSGLDAKERAAKDDPDLVLIKYGLTDFPGEMLAFKLRQAHETSGKKVLLYTAYSGTLDSSAINEFCRPLGIPDLIESNDPEILLEEINHAIGKE